MLTIPLPITVSDATDQILRDAHAVFLPAFDESSVPRHIAEHLSSGGTSVLIGESRREYVAREMDIGRRSRETSEWLARLTGSIRELAGGRALVAVDQELGGIRRLQYLATELPTAEQAGSSTDREIELAAGVLASECVVLGVNVVLSPIVDVVRGPNPWLAGRTISSDFETMRRVSVSFVRGLQESGRVAATAKHFPGHPHTPLDPAVHSDAQVESGRDDIDSTLKVFRAVSAAGVRVVMTGPALVPAIDPERAASRSAVTVDLLRNDVGFGGVILSDDLNAPGILRGSSVEEAAVEALSAGIDWLLVAGTPRLPNLVAAVADAVRGGRLSSARLNEAAQAVRTLTIDIG